MDQASVPTDVQALRRRTRQLDEGAVTPGYTTARRCAEFLAHSNEEQGHADQLADLLQDASGLAAKTRPALA